MDSQTSYKQHELNIQDNASHKQAYYDSANYVYEKYKIKAYSPYKAKEVFVDLYEKEFRCKMGWSGPDVALQFNTESDLVWFLLRWS